MNIQIYGSKKCFDTKKAERYFKERNIIYQFIEVHKFGMSKGIFDAAKRKITLEAMIAPKSKAYKVLYMDYIDKNKWEETLFENPALFATPIVRNAKTEFTLGYRPEVWQAWGHCKVKMKT